LTRQKLVLLFVVLIAFSGSYLAKKAIHGSGSRSYHATAATDSQGHVQGNHSRIISLAPSITETLFQLGLGDRVVGVTRYCDYPREALAKAKVGGYYDPNYEAILLLNPDLILMLPEHEEPREHLGKLGLSILVVDHKTIPGILNTIMTIGKVCGVEQAAESIVSDLRTRMEHIRQTTEGLPRPRVMISVGRNMGSLKDVYVSGRGGFYDEMITFAGGKNAYVGNIAFPVISGEGIIRLNPEVIIDMVPDLEEKGLDEAMILKEWETVSQVDALRNGRVHVFGQDYVVVPGPRFILIVEQMARVIHPQAEWK